MVSDKAVKEYWNNENNIPSEYLRFFGDKNER